MLQALPAKKQTSPTEVRHRHCCIFEKCWEISQDLYMFGWLFACIVLAFHFLTCSHKHKMVNWPVWSFLLFIEAITAKLLTFLLWISYVGTFVCPLVASYWLGIGTAPGLPSLQTTVDWVFIQWLLKAWIDSTQQRQKRQKQWAVLITTTKQHRNSGRA